MAVVASVITAGEKPKFEIPTNFRLLMVNSPSVTELS